MIFVTVGGQIPFDRLIAGVDAWAGSRRRSDVFAQIGPSSLRPENIEFVDFLAPDEFERRVADAEALVAHAGMGSILTALEHGKPILVLPRRAHLRETRSDHQLGTAQRLKARGLIDVALDETELVGGLDRLHEAVEREPIGAAASPRLIGTLREFIQRA